MNYTPPDPAPILSAVLPDPAPIKRGNGRVHPYVALARSYRQAHGISVVLMAAALEVKPKTYEQWELAKATPRQDGREKLAKFFHIKPDSEKSGKEAA